MNIKIVFKDPDALRNAIEEEVESQLRDSYPGMQIVDDLKILKEEKVEELYDELVKQWFTHGEYIVLHYDTETKTLIPDKL